MLRTLTIYACLSAASAALVWILMTDAQRHALMVRLGFEASGAPALPEIAVRRPPFDPEPGVDDAERTAYGMPRHLCRDWSRPTEDVDSTAIYRWTDDQGRVVYGDRPPETASVRAVGDRYAKAERFARARFVDHGERHGPALRSVFETDAAAIARILRYELGLPVRQVDVALTLEPADRLLDRSPGSRRHVAGLYRHGVRSISVREQPSLAQTRAVARHETLHAMLAALYGPTPPWVNEGLAEIAAGLEVRGQARTLTVRQGHARRLRRARADFAPGSLARLLSMDADAWRAAPSTRSYAAAWSLVHLLMESAAGRGVLTAVLEEQAARPCGRIDSLAIVDARWPDGARHLERYWRARLGGATWENLSF